MIINCHTLKVKSICHRCKYVGPDDCDIVWIKEEISRYNGDIKREIQEWLFEFLNNGTSFIPYLIIAVENFYPQHLKYLNTLLLLK
jgi:hypothetical protein